MHKAEILGAVSASTNLLENALSVIKCIRKALKRQKDLVHVLICHEDELDSIKTILQQLIKKENSDLHTASLGAELIRMQQVQNKLAVLLSDLDPGSKSKINQFARQLLEGSADEKKLSSIMDELAQIKASILLCIQMANVGLMQDMNRQIVADAAKIERIDSNLQKQLEQLDDYKGLRIARLIKGRRPSNDGTVPLTRADLQRLSSSNDDSDSASDTVVDSDSDTDAPSFDIPIKIERIILRNMALHQSCQINCPVGEDIWKDLVGRLVIRDNVAKDQAAQFNYAISLDALKVVMEAHGKNITAVSASQRRNRRDSAQEQGCDEKCW
ncbi:uncharacterized protein N0V89_007901 [Didymosphaeria variabile]|uniref:Fungal N-terminal domain-containing protein n=1 Tax=Didymosphaeria variabile TaxID=1932322 RepID=A0A9W8XKD7_9PLEO|nr:uncharacterized protein N0V89_007901 [Didymosphaeria variabile]KAJ4352552.1 hypothetical protein N0V89_007901 [Didymosphaeria variabile]